MGAGTLVMDLHRMAEYAAEKGAVILIAPGPDVFGPEIVYARGQQTETAGF